MRRRRLVAPLLLMLSGVIAGSGCAARSAYGGASPEAGTGARSLSDILSRLVWPLPLGDRRNVRSGYGYRGGGYGRYHYGVDLQAGRGDPVYSAADGIVAAVGHAGAYGNSIRVDHGQGLSSFYAHLDRVLTTSGAAVQRGQVIGLVGSTGNATGPHLHFELRWGDRWIDPLAVLPRLD